MLQRGPALTLLGVLCSMDADAPQQDKVLPVLRLAESPTPKRQEGEQSLFNVWCRLKASGPGSGKRSCQQV